MGKICKKTMGFTICKMKNGNSTVIPITKKNSIPIQIYVSDECQICNKIEPKIKKLNKAMGNIFNITKINVKNTYTPNNVISLPTTIIGDIIIKNENINKDLLILSVKKFFSKPSIL